MGRSSTKTFVNGTNVGLLMTERLETRANCIRESVNSYETNTYV